MLAKSCNTNNLLSSPKDSTPLKLRYHNQALYHDTVLFWVCLVAGSVLLGIAIALVLHALIAPVSLGLAAVDVGVSLILKLVSALFYKEMHASRERTIVLYDRIRRDDRLAQSAALASRIPDAHIKSATIAKLALQIASDTPQLPRRNPSKSNKRQKGRP